MTATNLHHRPPFQGLFACHSAFPGLRAALRRFIPGYCSIGASGAYGIKTMFLN
jgi:hypothetical protein